MGTWWQDRVVYQIYPRSFQDSNGDGIGDLRGIRSRLDELGALGVGILWLSPVYASPNDDNGYDISDYRSINPEFGTMEDMEELIAEARKRDIRIIMDLVINHSSSEHAWFQQSRERIEPYTDYYIWRPPRSRPTARHPHGKAPNNWTSFFAEKCWEYDERRGEYFLHLFSKRQPDLNWANPAVLSEVEGIMRFWLDKGIAGFRCDVINILFKESLSNGKPSPVLTGREHWLSREGTHAILRTLRQDVLSRYDCFAVGETVFVTPAMARDLCSQSRGELDMVFSFQHMETDCFGVKWFPRAYRPARLARVLSRWQKELEWNANYLENHDQPRSVSRFGEAAQSHSSSAKLLALLLLSLRGTPFVYQGQEIGMTNFDFRSVDELRDIESLNVDRLLTRLGVSASWRWKLLRRASRDNARTPMQWDASPNAGFTTGTPWLGVNGNYRWLNRATQEADPDSILNFWKRAITLRATTPALREGSFRALRRGALFAFERAAGDESALVLLNLSGTSQRLGRRLRKRAQGAQTLISTSAPTPARAYLAPWEGLILKLDTGRTKK